MITTCSCTLYYSRFKRDNFTPLWSRCRYSLRVGVVSLYLPCTMYLSETEPTGRK
jgi:hypothetical protein